MKFPQVELYMFFLHFVAGFSFPKFFVVNFIFFPFDFLGHNKSPYGEGLAYDFWLRLLCFNKHYCKFLIDFLNNCKLQ